MNILDDIKHNITTVSKNNKANWKRHHRALVTIMDAIRAIIPEGDEVCMCPTEGAFLPFDTDRDGYARFGANRVLGEGNISVSGNLRLLTNVGDIACMVVIPISYRDSVYNKVRSTTLSIDSGSPSTLDVNGIQFIVGDIFEYVELAIRQRYNQKSRVYWYGL